MLDCLIIGAGVAGLYTALNLPSSWKVVIIAKADPRECNTYYAQGGITTARDESDIPIHIADTFKAGGEIGNNEAIKILSNESLGIIDDLLKRGMAFDRNEKEELLYTKEAAHSTERILHADGDATGKELFEFLRLQNPHPLHKGLAVTDLVFDGDVCLGVMVADDAELAKGSAESHFLAARHIVIASGGVGSLYEFHTNATPISGELQGICARHGIRLKDMAFTQFHPTAFVESGFARKALLTEALRGEGATIVDEQGRRFVFDYDERGELASRDAVSQAIFLHKQKTNQQVFLNVRNFNEAFFAARFPNITNNMRTLGFTLPHDLIPISPAFHYMMGGIETDINGQVPNFSNLYAVGEVACTGVHGANRLASNSLLEGLVFGKRAALMIMNTELINSKRGCVGKSEIVGIGFGARSVKTKLRTLMWQEAGIIRSKKGMSSALAQILTWESEFPNEPFLLSRLACAKAIVNDALNRPQSIGSHYLVET